MIKFFCDKCNNEIEKFATIIPIYAYDGKGNIIAYIKDKHLCENCTKEFNRIKDKLKHEEDFFLDQEVKDDFCHK